MPRGVKTSLTPPCLRSPDWLALRKDPDFVFFIRSFQDGLWSDGDFGDVGGDSDLKGRGLLSQGVPSRWQGTQRTAPPAIKYLKLMCQS
jgi:hypothetical protein